MIPFISGIHSVLLSLCQAPVSPLSVAVCRLFLLLCHGMSSHSWYVFPWLWCCSFTVSPARTTRPGAAARAARRCAAPTARCCAAPWTAAAPRSACGSTPAPTVTSQGSPAAQEGTRVGTTPVQRAGCAITASPPALGRGTGWPSRCGCSVSCAGGAAPGAASRAPPVSAGDLPPTTVPPTTTTPRAPPRNVGTGTAELPSEQGERERSLPHLCFGVKTCIWKGNKSLRSFERKESVLSPVQQAFPQGQRGERPRSRRDHRAPQPFSCVEGKVLIFADPC